MTRVRIAASILIALTLAVCAEPAMARPPWDQRSEAAVAPPPIVVPPTPPPRPPHRRPPPCPWHPWHRPAMPEAPRGRLTLVTRPFAEVTIDGRLVGHTPLVGFHLDPGTHVVVVRADCGTVRRRVDVTPATDIQLSLRLCGLSP